MIDLREKEFLRLNLINSQYTKLGRLPASWWAFDIIYSILLHNYLYHKCNQDQRIVSLDHGMYKYIRVGIRSSVSQLWWGLSLIMPLKWH